MSIEAKIVNYINSIKDEDTVVILRGFNLFSDEIDQKFLFDKNVFADKKELFGAPLFSNSAQ